MGAEQSTGRGAGAAAPAPPQKTCYYELLSIERTATDDEIKKAYRRKALELHPDRNLDDTANATRRFAEVQTAYEVLSDPQERAWYDSHRDAIIRGDSGADDADAAGGDAGPRYYNNVRVTSTEELYTLMGRFHSGVAFDDSPAGFFGILEATFAQLALEEEAAASWDDGGAADPVQYAPFGGAGDSYETVARPFYRDWSGFATRKTFSWKDKYRLADAPDRAVRRLMDKENKKAREQAARDFNDAVRSLVAFVRKRDSRYVPNTQSEAERQKILRDSATAQAARQRAANQERRAAAHEAYVAPAWAQPRGEDGGPDASGLDVHEGGFSSDAESEVQHEIECVVCNKSFKSEKQFEAHEKSRKHIKAVQKLKWQMKKENQDLQLDAEPEAAQEAELEEALDVEQEANQTSSQLEDDEDVEPEDEGHQRGNREVGPHEKKEDSRGDDDEGEDDGEDDDSNDDYAPREVVERRFRTGGQDSDDDNDDDDDDAVDTHVTTELDGLSVKDGRSAAAAASAAEKKIGKAKAKREKKAARQAETAAAAGRSAVCSICSEAFASSTQLHRHLRMEHPAPAASAGKRKKKR